MPAEGEGAYAARVSILTGLCKWAILARVGSRTFCGPGRFRSPFVRVFRDGVVETRRVVGCHPAFAPNPNRQRVVASNAAAINKQGGC
jgi:hypothetical protein